MKSFQLVSITFVKAIVNADGLLSRLQLFRNVAFVIFIHVLK